MGQLEQVLEILVPDGTKKQPNFKVVRTLESVSYCPVLDFVYHAALSSGKRYSSEFSEVVASMVVGRRLVPQLEEQIRVQTGGEFHVEAGCC